MGFRVSCLLSYLHLPGDFDCLLYGIVLITPRCFAFSLFGYLCMRLLRSLSLLYLAFGTHRAHSFVFEDLALGLRRQTIPALVHVNLAISTLEFLWTNFDQVIIAC